MIEVYPRLWVGSDQDYQSVKDEPDWYFLQCAKDPYHRQALGYTTRSAPKDHPEYLYAYRENRLILNMVDADDPRYFPHAMIDEAMKFMDNVLLLTEGRLLVHCNRGESRAPSLALLFLVTGGWYPTTSSFEQAKHRFFLTYPFYSPKKGIYEYLEQHHDLYRGERG